jgi:hypothetical protein
MPLKSPDQKSAPTIYARTISPVDPLKFEKGINEKEKEDVAKHIMLVLSVAL